MSDDVEVAMVRQAMLTIKALDPSAHLEFSTYTKQWYVSAHLDESDGHVLTSLCEHFDDPGEAVTGFLAKLKSIPESHRLVSYGEYKDRRREYSWNGAVFAENPFPQVAQP